MSHTNCMIDSMIRDSICEDRIIRASHTSLLAAELDDCCGGSTETGSEIQYWGGAAGQEWRIHLVCGSVRRGTW